MMKLKVWIAAFRLRTLPLAFSCIFMGGFLAYSDGFFDSTILALSLITTLFLQILSNLSNDYGDSASGVDGDHRSGPTRQVQSGAISQSQMKAALVICALLAFISGLGLIFYSFPGNWEYILLFLGIGLGAIAAAIKYTVGERPYGYAGFGDLFVLIFFGLVGVGGSYFLYAHTISCLILLPATSCGLLAVGVLNVNNIRDIESDSQSGKRSIPVRIGRKWAIYYQGALLFTALFCAVCFGLLKGFTGLDWVFLVCLVPLVKNLTSIWKATDAAQVDPNLKKLALTTLLFVLLLGSALV